MANPALNENFNENQVKALSTLGSDFAAATATTRGVVFRAATVGTVTSANAGGTYTAAEQTLINELKTDLNALIAAFQAAGQLS